MQIEFFFTCRECGADTRILWDTARELDAKTSQAYLDVTIFLGVFL